MSTNSKLVARAATAYRRHQDERNERQQQTDSGDFMKLCDALRDIGFDMDGAQMIRNRAAGGLCVSIVDTVDTRRFDPETDEFGGEFRPGVAATLRDGLVWIVAEDIDGEDNYRGRYLPVGVLMGLETIGQALAAGGRAEHQPWTVADEVNRHLNAISGDHTDHRDELHLNMARAICAALMDVADAIREHGTS